MKRQTPGPRVEPSVLLQRTQQLRLLWQSLPAYVSAFAPRRSAAG